ncbi:MAG: HAD-IC family P-type ATPase, partial [Hungatella sp.]
MNAWYQLSKEETLRCLDTGLDGLSSDQAQNRLNQYGTNTLTETGRKKAWQIFLAQFQDLLVIILVAAALVSMVSDQVESTIVIFAVILLNAILGTVQHQKAQKSLDSLKALSSPSAKVLRDGETIEIDSTEVVPGDILFLETGDLVVADGRILENYALQTDESSLTGESVHVEKKETQIFHASTVLADRSNMIFSGSLVTAGRVVAVVTETGMQTEIGKIAALMNQTESVGTPLQVSLDQFSGRLALAIMGICAFVFGLSLYRRMPLLDSLMFAVALAVAAIPEALGSIVTIVQAMGTQKMAKEHAIIKDLKAVESLGCVSVICSDKTGTLTQNRMSVSQLYLDHQWIHPEQLNLHNPVHQYLLYGAVLVNDAVMRAEKKIGDPTEFALLAMAAGAGIEEESCRSRMPRYGELPFDSARKRMSTVHCIAGKRLMLTKGAPDVLLECSTQILLYGGVR